MLNSLVEKTLPLLFGNGFQTSLHGVYVRDWKYTELQWITEGKMWLLFYCWFVLPLNASCSLFMDLASGSRGVESFLDLSYWHTKGRKTNNRGLVWHPCVTSPGSSQPNPIHKLHQVLTFVCVTGWDGCRRRLLHLSVWKHSAAWPQFFSLRESGPTKVLLIICAGRKLSH